MLQMPLRKAETGLAAEERRSTPIENNELELLLSAFIRGQTAFFSNFFTHWVFRLMPLNGPESVHSSANPCFSVTIEIQPTCFASKRLGSLTGNVSWQP
jgi:hypothetical protein